MKRFNLLSLITVLIFSSCSVVKKNGFYQSIAYKPKKSSIVINRKKTKKNVTENSERFKTFKAKKKTSDSLDQPSIASMTGITGMKNLGRLRNKFQEDERSVATENQVELSIKERNPILKINKSLHVYDVSNSINLKINKDYHILNWKQKTPSKSNAGIVIQSVSILLLLVGLLILIYAAGGGVSTGVWVLGTTLIIIACFLFVLSKFKTLPEQRRWKFIRVVSIVLLIASIPIILLEASGWGFGIGMLLLGISLAIISIYLLKLSFGKLKKVK